MTDASWDPVDVFNELRASPLPKLSEASQKFLKEDAEGWSVSRKRQLEAALNSGDKEQFTFVLKEYAAVVGKNSAIQVVLAIWERMIAQ